MKRLLMKRQLKERQFMEERSGKRYRIYLPVVILSVVLLSGCGRMEKGSGQDRGRSRESEGGGL